VACLAGLQQYLAQRAPAGIGRQVLQEQALQVRQELVWIAPDAQRQRQRVRCQRVALLAPVVLRRLDPHGLFVGHQGFIEQAAAVESMLPEHALAPGVNRVHRRSVHALGRQGQRQGCLPARGWVAVAGHQIGHEPVARGHRLLATKTLRSIQQALSNPVGELAGCRPGEGHHQNIGWQQGAGKALVAPMPQHQAHIQRSDGPGLARASACLYQAAAPELKQQGVQHLLGALGCGPARSRCRARLSWLVGHGGAVLLQL